MRIWTRKISLGTRTRGKRNDWSELKGLKTEIMKSTGKEKQALSGKSSPLRSVWRSSALALRKKLGRASACWWACRTLSLWASMARASTVLPFIREAHFPFLTEWGLLSTQVWAAREETLSALAPRASIRAPRCSGLRKTRCRISHQRLISTNRVHLIVQRKFMAWRITSRDHLLPVLMVVCAPRGCSLHSRSNNN